MLQLTLGEALERIDEEYIMVPFIYAYEDTPTIFYIGHALEPFERLRQHMGKTARSTSPDTVGELILENMPHSLEWSMQIYTIQELFPERLEHYKQRELDIVLGYRILAENVESLLIAQLHPCLNLTYNKAPAPLPEKYRYIEQCTGRSVRKKTYTE